MRYTIRMMATLAALGFAATCMNGFAKSEALQAADVSLSDQNAAVSTETEAAHGEEARLSAKADATPSPEEESMAREQIAGVQQMLIDLGYLYGAADGIYGPMTVAALKRFQAGHGLEETGELNDATVDALSELAEQVGDARALQQRLIDLGYLNGSADGAFGERSQAALRQFQAVHGLEATGLPDDETREALFSDRARSLPRRLGVGSKGDEVAALQDKLIQYGFLDAEADGSYGAKTSSAVSRFQKHLQAQGKAAALGVEPTGEATPMTLLALYDPDYSSYLEDVRAGDERSEVLRVERRLCGLGYMDATPDEAFDEYAVSAAEAFRAAMGIQGTAYDRAFIDALFSADAPAAEHFVTHPIVYGDAGAAVLEVQEALVNGGMTISLPDGVYGSGLAKGIDLLHEYLAAMGSPRAFLFEDDNALSVEAQQLLTGKLFSSLPIAFTASDTYMTYRVQRRLHTLYYLSKDGIDGSFGDRTRDALLAFQEANHLPKSGFPDTQTLDRLFSPNAIYKVFPYRLEVSIDRQRVYVYESDESGEYTLTQTFTCSSGMGNTTPRGIYLDGTPCNVWHYFKKFDCWARYSYVIEGDIMFHSVLYSERDTDTLRENSLYALGQKASHGCVRLSVKNARWIFEHCSRGSVVIIIY